jgi:cation diffusion facilitator family transporter
VVALVGNLIVAIAKLVAGILSGSAAMMAESAHSFADSANEVLLGISILSSRKPADATHPFGYGRERFLWAFLAAISSFVIGGCVSVGLAVRELEMPSKGGSQTLSWIVLSVALIADGVSWIQGMLQARREARLWKRAVWSHIWQTSDPVLRAVLVEDSAGLIGTALAAGGLLLSNWLGSGIPDAIASLLIGVLLAGTAIAVARPLADFLIGRSLPDGASGKLHDLFLSSPAVDQVIGVQTVYTGPGEVIVTAKINAAPCTMDEFATAMDALDHQIREEIPLVADVFVDVTASKLEDSG